MPYLPCEGVFAVNKPSSISSAQVVRDAQTQFHDSKFFQPWFSRELKRRDEENHNQRQKRRSWKQRQPLKLKIGHGGTLDPMARGVLILGVGNGTKALGGFLGCTKSYEAVVLFGAATDSFDAVGKIIGRKEWEGVTKEKVEEALGKFRGEIMQRPPVYSALSVQGKRLYEYAREGKQVPVEIVERPVEVKELEMVEWMEGGTHEWQWPVEEAGGEEQIFADKVLELGAGGLDNKRSRDVVDDDDGDGKATPSKQAKVAKGAKGAKVASESTSPTADQPPQLAASAASEQPASTDLAPCPAPACRIRMTVGSGFYVRSLCHDLGAAVGSLALMSDLVRSRQGDFALGKNVLEYEDMAKGEDAWGGKVKDVMEEWRAGEEAKGADQPQSEDDRPVKNRRGHGSGSSRGFEKMPDDHRKPEKRRRNSSSEDE